MAISEYEIINATPGDVDDIVALQDRNLRERGGGLTARFSREWFAAALSDMPVLVARRGDELVGYLVSSSLAAQSHLPVVQAMLRAYRGDANSYLYGPICVAESERGQGLPSALMSALRARLAGREGITFIRRDNVRSMRAHGKIGMCEVAAFTEGDAKFVVISQRG
jgi:L-amino acid N-acyltransferase YncA